MRGCGGSSTSRGSLRGHPKGKAAQGPSSPGANARLAPGRRLRSASLLASSPEATAVQVAYGTSANNSKAHAKKRHREIYVPLQRHMFTDDRIFLPCANARKRRPS